ncbi:non-specific lipid transfer protein GPI-anchored 5-like [Impatiens glandulifera]|uniref:non-specific lipid transfer protein GPI-anchored 5-like n=1 Tax=Impatiens glandulifera TaxID=253017 RepID=UPI001FB11318|nr:non-specific lipid transfer protein GPI-anchored 5-like [Impatiens glandulifera]
MAILRIEMILVVSAMLCIAGVMAQSSSCIPILISLSPCLNYLSKNTLTPSSSCCSQLGTIVRSSPQCLCEALNQGGSSFGLNIDQTRAIALLGACNVQTFPLSSCNVGSPANSPAGSPGNQNRVPSDSGSKTIPSTNNGSSSKMTISLLFVAICIAYFGSNLSLF